MDRYLRNIYRGVYTVLVGMRVTIRQFFEPNVTHQYPYEHDYEKKQNVREIPKGYRGQLYNRTEDCIGCKKCEMICPVDCITIDATKLPKGEQLWDSMNVVHFKDGREIIGIIEGDDKKSKNGRRNNRHEYHFSPRSAGSYRSPRSIRERESNTNLFE